MKQTLIDECLLHVDNRFELARVIAYRTKQLNRGLKPLVEKKGKKNIMTSMYEIADGKVYLQDSKKDADDEQ